MLVECKSKSELNDLYKDGKLIGRGTTAKVYLKNDQAIKVYRNTSRKRYVFNEFDMKTHLDELSEVKVKNIWTPNDIYIYEDEVKAITLDYIEGKTIKKEIPDVSLKLFLDYLKELKDNLRKLSEHKIWVVDFYCGNAIVNQNGINIIDTDNFYFSDISISTCLEHNISKILHEIFDKLFDFNEYFHFYSEYLDSLLIIYFDIFASIEADFDLYKALISEFGEDTSLRDLKRLIKSIGEIDKTK